MSYEDEHVVLEALSQELTLDVPVSGMTGNPVEEGGPILVNLRPLRATADPTIIPRQSHLSSFVSDSVYDYLDSTIFSRKVLTPIGTKAITSSDAIARSLESATSIADLPPDTADHHSTILSFPISVIERNHAARLVEIDNNYRMTADERARARYEAEARFGSLIKEIQRRQGKIKTDKSNWLSHNSYTMYYAPFYVVLHPSESAPSPTHDPGYRALPILAPNLSETDLDRCRFLAHPPATYPDTRAQPPGTTSAPPLSGSRPSFVLRDQRDDARVFVAFWVAPTEGRKKIAGWRAADRYKTTTFRLRPRTPELRERLADERDRRRQARAEGRRPAPKDRNWFGRSRDLTDSRRSSIGKATVIAAAAPDIDADLSSNPDYEFDVGAQVMAHFNDLLLRPRISPSGSKVVGLEPPSDEEFGGLVAILELPRYYSPYFAQFSLKKPKKQLTAQQKRRLLNQRRRPVRPQETHCIIAPSGITRILPSLAHLSLILPPNAAPTEVKIRCRRVRSISSSLAVRIFVDPDAEPGSFTGGRNESGTTCPADLLKRLAIDALPHDPEHPHCFFLEEPPLLTLPTESSPTKSGMPELTLLFRNRPYDHALAGDHATAPTPESRRNEPLPDGEYVLDEPEESS